MVPDWRDSAAYAPLAAADRSLFAWEWLRRDPAYRAAAQFSGAGAASPGTSLAADFGLVAFEPPWLGVPEARPLWRRAMHPYVLEVRAAGGAGGDDDRFDLDGLRAIARLLADDGGEHLLLSDGLRSIRLDGPHGSFAPGPVCPSYSIRGLASADAPLLTLRRFLALVRSGHFARTLHAPEVRARRWILTLRASDALAAGAGQRKIAEVLLGGSVGLPRWRSREPSIRSQAQRLVRSARQLASGGYRALLS